MMHDLTLNCSQVVTPAAASIASGTIPLVAVATRQASNANVHDRATLDVLATRVAALLGLPFIGECGTENGGGKALFLLPAETLDAADAATLGIDGSNSFLGGVVPFPFVSTKAITHGLVSPAAPRPPGWSDAMADVIAPAVLSGFTAFDRPSAVIAGRQLLARGPVRVKPVRGKAGLGQTVVNDAAELAVVLDQQDAAELHHYGLCLEENLTDVVTYSVGAAAVGPHHIAYWGTQQLTTDNMGQEVYGGSKLTALRGDLAELLDATPDPLIRHVVAQAITFDRSAHQAYSGLCLSRRNYDIIEGTDAAGMRRVAVLEQSWRVGGASGAEIAAMEAFAADPSLTTVTTATSEVHGRATPPDDATLYYDGIDPVVGPLTKWALRL